MNKSVMVGMSGGVDSAAAAAILKNEGYKVCGITLRLLPIINDIDKQSEEDAKKVCDALGIEHYVFDFCDEFNEKVISYFVKEYLRGRTPNPCIACNKHIKFKLMYEKAKEMGYDYIATGHYAKIENNNGIYELRMSGNKDQSYVLYNLNQEILSHTLMPLGDYEKEEIREICRKMNLPIAEKKESMEICFVKNDDYVSFIKDYADYKEIPGNIKDVNGNVIGKHNGLINYTVGQRKGIGAYGRPMFVLKIDSDNNELILGEKGMEFSDSLIAEDVNFLSDKFIEEPITANVKIRYQAKPAKALIKPLEDNRVEVVFEAPQRAVTPGQAVVFYDEDKVLGGGTVV